MSRKILIVSSDSGFVKELHLRLKESSLEGIPAYDGIQAVNTAIREKPELIILDAGIRGGGGVKVLKNLQASSLTSLIPVIFMADPAMKDMEEKALGVEAFMVKPINLEELLILTGNILAKAKEQLISNVKIDKKEAQEIYSQIKTWKNSSKEQREKKLILVVDDEADILQPVSYRLKKAGYDVIEAGDGITGLAKAKENVPDLIVLDLMLPKLDGFKVCRMLKFDDDYKHIPIIMFTARTGEDAKLTGKEVGADAYILKPFEPEILLSKIKELLS